MAIDQWTLAQAKRDHRIGYLTFFRIERAPMRDGWNIILKGGTNNGPLVDARSSDARVFKTLEAAVSTLEKIGFKVEAVCLH
jgi:hypothetical protein